MRLLNAMNDWKALLAGASALALLAACGNGGEETDAAPATPPADSIDAGAASQAPGADASSGAETASTDAGIDPVAASEGPGTPALWTLSDEDTTIYIFGTVHLLKPELEWRTPEFDAALASIDTLYTEADVLSPAAQAEGQKLVMDLGMLDGGETLTAILDDADEKEVKEALDILGLPMAALDPMEPWMASITLSQVAVMQQGYAPGAGVESVLIGEAEAAGKELAYFETIEEQLNFFANLPDEDQVDFLVASAEAIENEPDMLDRLVAEWAEGDVQGLGEMMADPGAFGSQTVYDVLLVERNRNWIPQIEAILEEPGTVMVAVGAGHLAGDDSLITMLRDKGYEVTGP